ncbi:MAG: UDP-N-acetylglucosamine--N-acetylmuramyl-(pentapeptide) pyrophosphoryl-undecaprenol N-acetylglucosamine transferase [Candidatus Omnitrophica bacterium]|nr:UDP-N-acetylglucosamine--N-acetylmuramyl-(pentapeptide) pyrophosphoryl-undecaprenol N-acetylglucosamine transferase [Candidatus Omnitrophota bacterium]
MRVLIACGGTAGHIFPGLALWEELSQEKDCAVVLVVSVYPRDKKILQAVDFSQAAQLETVNSCPLPYRVSWRYLPFGLSLIGGLLKSLVLVLRYRPDVVVGFGGSAAFSPLIVARMLGVPTLIHEQNLLPGRANQVLSRFATQVAISFEATERFFPRAKIKHTGFPLRKQLQPSAAGQLKKNAARFNIAVLGGSQGAHRINQLVLESLSLIEQNQRRKLRLIHLSGKNDYFWVKQSYLSLGLDAEVFDFLKDMAGVYRVADLVISRSGAGTIFELAHFGLPAILLPHAFGTGHQRENSLLLARRQAAIVLEEQNTSAADLKQILLELMDNQALRQGLSEKIKTLDNPSAGRDLKEQVLTLSKRH